MRTLIIIGAGGLGKEVTWLVERINQKQPTWELLGFLDDKLPVGSKVGEYVVLGPCEDIIKYPNAAYVCAVGGAKARKKLIEKLETIVEQTQYATLIDPTVDMGKNVSIGEGSMIFAHSIFTVDVTVGKHAFIGLDCTVSHDAVIGDVVSVYPSVNISGSTKIGNCVEIGTGTQMIQGKSVGDCAIVGAGAVIVKDIPANCTAVGCPAKPIKFEE